MNLLNIKMRLGGTMYYLKKVFVVVMVIMLTAILTFSQTGQVGSIKGTVSAPDGTALPGVSVTAKSDALVIGKMVTITNMYGYYRFPTLPPGKYDLTFEMEGMNTAVRTGIVLNANMNVTVDYLMQFKSISESVIVEGKAPTIDRQSVSRTATISDELLKELPAARNISTYFNMTPGITGDSAHGAAVRDNAYNIDGVQTNDPAVGTAIGYFSMDVMEELSVQAGGLSAEYGSVKGAAVNVLTKSGGNRFSGDVSMYYTHEKLASDNAKGTSMEGQNIAPKYEMEPGINLGGPIKKDKLWFFVNLSMYKGETYRPGFPYDQVEGVPIKDTNIYPYVKLTYQPSQNDKFVLSANYSRRNISHSGADRFNTVDTTRKQLEPSLMLNSHWTHNFSDKLLTNIKFGAFINDLRWTVKKKGAYYYDYYTGRNSNSYGFDDLNPRNRFQLNIDGTGFVENLAGSHEMKFGIQANYGVTTRVVTTYGDEDSIGIPGSAYYTWKGTLVYREWWDGFEQKAAVLNIGAFYNDTWSLSKRLTLNLGVRYDHSSSIIPKTDVNSDYVTKGDFGYIGLPDIYWDMVVPKSYSVFKWNNISPRLGMVYDLLGNGKTLFKANFSHYIQDNYTAISFEMNPVNWVGYGAYVNPDGSIIRIDYTQVPGITTQVGYKNHKLKAPYTNEVTLSLERELWEDFSVSFSFTRRWDRNLIEDADSSVLDMDALMERGELVWKNYKKVTVTDPYDGKTQLTFWDRTKYVAPAKYIVNPPGAKRDYKGIEVIFNKRYSRGWSFNASYVYANATGLIGTRFWDSEGRTGFYNDPNAHENAYGRMPQERRHQFKLQALVKGPLGINLSGYFRILAGYRYTRTVSSMDLGLDMNSHTTINAESRGSYGLPTLRILDLRLEKDLRFSKTFVLKLFCDVFNVFNVNTVTDVIVSSSGSIPFQTTNAIYTPRVFRLGTKLSF